MKFYRRLSTFELPKIPKKRLGLCISHHVSKSMEDFFSEIQRLAADNLFLLLGLYGLALFRPRKILLVIAFVLACVCATSLYGYPDVYLDNLFSVLTSAHLMPDIEIFAIPDDYLPDVHRAFTRGAYLSLASVGVVYMIAHPMVKLLTYKPANA